MTTTYANPYWDAVSSLVHVSERHSWDVGPFVGGEGHYLDLAKRGDMVSEYAWTITDPATVAFVAEHAGPRVIDPLAGTGYWAWLLTQHGADVAASDLYPPDAGGNKYHKRGALFAPVARLDAVDVVAHHPDRTLFLAWPPYDEPLGARVLAAYQGARVVFIGEGEGGCTGGDDMWTALGTDWIQVVDHRPVQWYGLHDWVTVYDRKPAS